MCSSSTAPETHQGEPQLKQLNGDSFEAARLEGQEAQERQERMSES